MKPTMTLEQVLHALYQMMMQHPSDSYTCHVDWQALREVRDFVFSHLAERDAVDPKIIAEETMKAWGDEIPHYSFNFRGLIADGIRRALLAQPSKAQPVVPDDWVLVPREPTTYMLAHTGTMNNYDVDAGGKSDADHIEWWKAMLDAAPKGVI